MTTFIVFLASLFCILFFLSGTIFKFLAAVFCGLVTSAGSIGPIARWAFFCHIGVLCLLDLVNSMSSQSVLGKIGIVMAHVMGVAIIIGLGYLLFKVVLYLLGILINVLFKVSESIALFCERAYAYFLSVIIRRLYV